MTRSLVDRRWQACQTLSQNSAVTLTRILQRCQLYKQTRIKHKYYTVTNWCGKQNYWHAINLICWWINEGKVFFLSNDEGRVDDLVIFRYETTVFVISYWVNIRYFMLNLPKFGCWVPYFKTFKDICQYKWQVYLVVFE